MLRSVRIPLLALLALVAVGGIAVASRNSGGTYSLPAGNPVIPGTTISTTWANNTLSDLATEVTNSLDRSGRGAMLAPLQCTSGSVTSPSLTFSAETGSGLYRIGTNDFGFSVNQTKRQEWTTTGSTIVGTFGVSGAATLSSGATVTGSGSGAGVSSTGGGTNGNGGTFTGGATNGSGLSATGAGTGAGIGATGGASNGTGVIGTGGASSGAGGSFFGGSPNGVGLFSTGTGTGTGAQFSAGIAATAAIRQDAMILINGDIRVDGIANPNSNVAFKNRITPKNIAKAWGVITCGNPATVTDGFNIASLTAVGAGVQVNFAQAMASANYVVVATTSPVGGDFPIAISDTLGTGSFQLHAMTQSAVNVGNFANCSTAGFRAGTLSFVVYGAQ